MDPYSGLVDLFEKQGLLVKDGNRLKYIDSSGNEHKEYRKAWTGERLDMIMKDFDVQTVNTSETAEETVVPDEEPQEA